MLLFLFDVIKAFALCAAVLCIGCGVRAEGRVDPPECIGTRPTWFNIPLNRGSPDATLGAGTGGLALRAVDGGTGAPINGAQVILRRDTLQRRSGSPAGAVSTAGVAVIRDLSPGEYFVEFLYIGYQPFNTRASVRAGRVDTMTVTVYQTVVCLLEHRDTSS
jgi:hypothetical protein